jgi:D-3-phosphoglycerate dehydrogenase
VPRVVITDSDFGRGEVEARELGEDYVVSFADSRDPEVLRAAIGEAEMLMVQWAQIDGSLMDAAPGLRGIVRFGMGLDNIDLDAARSRGIDVRNVDDFCIDEVADHATAMILASSRRLWTLNDEVKAGRWAPDLVPASTPPSESVVGIAGLGRIGAGVARRVHALGFRVAYWDAHPDVDAPSWAMKKDSLIELAEAASYLSLHIPLTTDTHAIVSRDVLVALGSSGYLINVGRGGLVDESALWEALESGGIAGACLDVLSTEPPSDGLSGAIARHPRALVTPHVAYLSTAALDTLRRHAAQRVKAILE